MRTRNVFTFYIHHLTFGINKVNERVKQKTENEMKNGTSTGRLALLGVYENAKNC